MGWFSKGITDPEKTYESLISEDKSTSERAANDFVNNINNDYVHLLCEKFEETDQRDIRLKITDIFAKCRSSLGQAEMRRVLKLICLCKSPVRESFKEILQDLREVNLKAVTDTLAETTDRDIYHLVQDAIEKSGILDRMLAQWDSYSVKDQILYMEELIRIQNPKTYPILMDILKDARFADNKDERRIIQMEFTKHIDKIKSPDFLDFIIKRLPEISSSMRYPVFKCLQKHGDSFFSQLFDGLEKKNDAFRQHTFKLLEQLSDPLSYKYLFPFLLDKSSGIPPTVRTTISNIVKSYCDNLSELKPNRLKSEETQNAILDFVQPLESCLNSKYAASIKVLTESILRIGRYQIEVILRNFYKIYNHNEVYFKSFLRGLEVNNRKNLLIKACCHEELETGLAAVKLLSDPAEDYILATLQAVFKNYFLSMKPDVQKEMVSLTFQPKLKHLLTDAIRHDDHQQRSRILWILAESNNPKALDMISDRVTDSDYSVRENILKILDLKQFQNLHGTGVLLNLLKDTNTDIVLKTIEMLKEREHPNTIKTLTKYMNSHIKEIAHAAHKATAYITRRKYLSGFFKMNDEMRLKVGTSLIKLDKDFMEDMSRDLSDTDQKTRVLAARVLEVLCEHLSPDHKTHLIVAIQDPDPHVRAVVIMGLGKIGGPSVANMLTSFLKDPDDRVRANAVEALAEVGDESVTDDVLACLYDEHNRVRANAVSTLWKLGYYNIYDAVLGMFKHKDKWMRASVAFALGEIKDPKFLPILLQFLKDTDPEVRRNIVKALGKIATPWQLAPYIRPLRFDSNEGVRKEVLSILSSGQQSTSK